MGIEEQLEKARQEGIKEGIQIVWDKLDLGVCEFCKYEHHGCYRECNKNGWEWETFKEWLKETANE